MYIFRRKFCIRTLCVPFYIKMFENQADYICAFWTNDRSISREAKDFELNEAGLSAYMAFIGVVLIS